MFMKKVLFFVFMLIIGNIALQAGDNIHLVQNDPPVIDPEDAPRSIESEVSASIDAQVITVSFSELTASQIVVRDSANLTVFDQTYTSAYSAQADISTLPSGSYTLHIYALGYWWYGHFNL